MTSFYHWRAARLSPAWGVSFNFPVHVTNCTRLREILPLMFSGRMLYWGIVSREARGTLCHCTNITAVIATRILRRWFVFPRQIKLRNARIARDRKPTSAFPALPPTGAARGRRVRPARAARAGGSPERVERGACRPPEISSGFEQDDSLCN